MPASVFAHHRLWGRITLGFLAVLLPLWLFDTVGFLKAFELQFLDRMMKLRGHRDPSPNLILVTIDNQAANALGSPLPRRYYTQLLRALSQYGAKTIVLDLQFNTHHDVEADIELAKLMQSLGNVIQPFLFQYRLEDDFDHKIERATPQNSAYAQFSIRPKQYADLSFILGDSAMLPHRIFIETAAKAGLVFIYPDDDGGYRRLPLLCKNFGKVYAALSLLAICDYHNISPDSLRIQQNFWGYQLALPFASTAVNIPINRQGQTLLNFYGPFEAFKSYSILDILESLQELEQRKAPRVPLRDFAGKIVLLGTNESLRKDFFVTPFAEDFPGMGIHATAISNFLNGDSLRQLPQRLEAGLVIILALLLTGGMLLASRLNKARETIYAGLIFGAILLAFNACAYVLLFESWHVVPPMLKTNGALVLLFVATTIYEKNWGVRTLNREVGRLESAMQERLAEMNTLNAKISARDEEYKTLEFLIKDFENLFSHPPAELTSLLQNPLDRMRLVKEQIRYELDHLHDDKHRLENENKDLESQIIRLRAIQPEPAPGAAEKNKEAPTPGETPQKKLEEMNGVMEQYKKFRDKAQVTHYFDPAFNMITAVMNGRPDDEPKKSKMQEIFSLIERISPYDSTVLITGAIGTGKTELAKAIHHRSRRKQGPFKCINIASIPENLIESELFGHTKGAFTGALNDRKGAFEYLNGGTIVLDEIGDLKPESQVKLLHVLQEKKFSRVGSNEQIEVDVRIITATNQDLQELIREKKFREDLYSRLNVIRIQVPPLRERREEIPHYVHYFLANFNKKYDQQKRVSDDALMAMILHDWQNNIRDLKNAVDRAYVHSGDHTIRLGDLDEDMQKSYRAVFTEQSASMWEGLVKSARAEIDNLMDKCRELLHAGNVEQALQLGQLKMGDLTYESCYECIQAYLDNEGSSFPHNQREKLAKQIIVVMQKELYAWCKEEKLGSMEVLSKEIEKLLGRGRRQVDNWEREVGAPAR